MILDIITIALIVVPMGIGMWRGLLYVAVRLLGWIGALAGGFFAAPVVRDFLADGFVGSYVHNTLQAHFESTGEGITGATDGLPAILASTIDAAVADSVNMVVQTLEHLVLTVIGFLAVAILIRLILIFVIRPISKRKGNSPVSFVNKVLGLLVGSIEGLLLAFLFLAALIPVMQMSSPETASAIADGLRFSYVAGALYDGNFLLALFG